MTKARLLVVVLGIAALSSGMVWWAAQPVGPGPAQTVEIPRGAATLQIGRMLAARRLVRSPLAFALYSRLMGLEGRLQAGEYRISPMEPMGRILRRLAAGDVVRYPVLLPEGITAREIAGRLEAAGLARAERFLALVRRPEQFWIPQMAGNRSGTLEGYLFPDTYLLPRGLSEEEIVRILVERFRSVTADLLARPLPLGLSPHEVVTVASLVEREARVPEERARIAGVIYNRLRRGMPLQIDASVLYALGTHKTTVRLADLEVDSPYNTYRRKGLPPGPIANPGREALQAAVAPEAHDFLYYVAGPDGRHIFSRTFSEHLQAIRSVQGRP